MALNRRVFLKKTAFFSGFMACYAPFIVAARTPRGGSLAKATNGLYTQPWFKDGLLDLREELEAASSEGKKLALIYEQADCPYCKDLHKVVFAKTEIVSLIKQNFRFVQINIQGTRAVTGFNGKEKTEGGVAREWGVHFTPTVSFFPQDVNQIIGKSGREAEAFRLPGYWEPFHFGTVLQFVCSGSYRKSNFQSYLTDRAKLISGTG